MVSLERKTLICCFIILQAVATTTIFAGKTRAVRTIIPATPAKPNASDNSTRSTSTPVNSYSGTINVNDASYEWRNGSSMHLDIGASTRLTATGVTP